MTSVKKMSINSPPKLEELLDRIGISKHIIDQKCSNEHIPTLANFLSQWRALVPRLGITDLEQDGIQRDGYDEPERRLEVLRMWRRKNGMNATYRWLVDAFLRAGNADGAEEVCRLLVPDDSEALLLGNLSPDENSDAEMSPKDLAFSQEMDDRVSPWQQSGDRVSPWQSGDGVSPWQSGDRVSPRQSGDRVSPWQQSGDGNGRVFPWQQSGEQQKNEDTPSIPIGQQHCCCCLIKHDGGQDAHSGVIVKLTPTPEELMSCLPGLKPSIDKYGPLKTNFVLITSHHVISGMSDAMDHGKGWCLDLGLGKKHTYKLESLVCGAVSCCGKDGIISSGSDPLDGQKKLFKPHPEDPCYLKLGFTMLFLNEKFENSKRISSKVAIPELSLNIPKPNRELWFKEQDPNSVPDTQLQLQLYQRVGKEITIINVLLQLKIQQDLDTPSSPLRQLGDEIKMNKQFQKIYYTCTPECDSKIKDGFSGSPVVYYDPVNKKTHLVGIHVGGKCDRGYYGVTTYEIFQLLKGKPAAIFAIMDLEFPLARRMWPGRWAHLLINTLGGFGPQENQPYEPIYLVEVVHILLREFKTLRLISLNVDCPSKLKNEPALQLLAALFKCFEGSKYGEIEAAISGDGGVFDGDNEAQKKFRADLQNLSESLVNFLNYLQENAEDTQLVNTYFECHNMMLNFKEKDNIIAVLCSHDQIDHLKSLRKKYKSLDIERNFNDILEKCHHMEKEECESQLQKKRQKLQEQHESQLLELRGQHESQLQEQRQEYELKLTQLREQLEKEIELRQQCEHQQRKNSDSKQFDSQVQQRKETNV